MHDNTSQRSTGSHSRPRYGSAAIVWLLLVVGSWALTLGLGRVVWQMIGRLR